MQFHLFRGLHQSRLHQAFHCLLRGCWITFLVLSLSLSLSLPFVAGLLHIPPSPVAHAPCPGSAAGWRMVVKASSSLQQSLQPTRTARDLAPVPSQCFNKTNNSIDRFTRPFPFTHTTHAKVLYRIVGRPPSHAFPRSTQPRAYSPNDSNNETPDPTPIP